MRARNELLLSLPAHRAEVVELADALLKERAIHVQVSDAAGHFLGSVQVLGFAGELHASAQVVTDSLDGDILHKPFGFHAINTGHIVVELLEEVDHQRHVFHREFQTTLQNVSIAAKVFIAKRCSALVDLFHGKVAEDYIGW